MPRSAFILDIDAAIGHLSRTSRFARDLMNARPDLRADLEVNIDHPVTRADMETALADRTLALDTALRRLRSRTVLRLLARDLTGRAELDEVLSTMTALAEVTVRRACTDIHAELVERHGVPQSAEGLAQELVVVAMGKLGGGELNVSSDIDLIFVYPDDGRTSGPRSVSNHEFFGLLGRRLVGALHERTADGFVFRVDTRLRPHGESGPPVVSFAMLEDYLVAQGRPWERFAWLKARPITGSRHEELARIVEPFVFRRYLDFSALASLRDLHQQIRAEVGRRQSADDVKVGPGGIREIEFVAQVFQLIRGGRDTSLRVRGTRAALARLRELRLLPPEAVGDLLEAYAFLRDVEHRLQYAEDAQTQRLPSGEDARALLAQSMGFAGTAEFMAALDHHRSRVDCQFASVFVSTDPSDSPLATLWRGQADDEAGRERLRALGYRSPDDVLARLHALRNGSRYRGLSEAGRNRFDELMPQILESAARTRKPEQALDRLLDLLQAIAARSAYLALLCEYPRTVDQIAELAASSRWALQYLTQHPMLMDELLDQRTLLAPPDWQALTAELESTMAACAGDTERELDALRHFKQSVMFRLIVQDLEGLLTLEVLSDHLSALADLLLAQVCQRAWATLPRRHREGPARFAVIGFGKLGGKELGYGSDLDLIFVYDDPDPAAAECYARLAQRMNQWLSAYTGAGMLYETDLRLRPDGASGMLVTSLEAFRQYQCERAWVWEHQALTRARFCAGDAATGRAFEDVRIDILRLARDPAKLRSEVVAMRERMTAEHPHAAGTFDVKRDPGGIIDVEFMVQFVVLAHAAAFPELTANSGNIALLELAGRLGLAPAGLATRAADSYRELRRLQHAAWLHEDREARVSPESVELIVAPVRDLWARLMVAPLSSP